MMSPLYFGDWIDKDIRLWSPGSPDPDNGLDETNLTAYFRDILTPEQLAAHLGVDLEDLVVRGMVNARVPVWRGETYLGSFVGDPRGPFHPSQACVDLARSNLAE